MRFSQPKNAFRLIILVFLTSWQTASACTTFFINQNGQLVFGRNYDWVSGSGTVNTNQRGLAKTSFQMPEGNTTSWVSKYGSITFNQYGKEFPTGGMNEKGLVVELMWLNETQYPAPDKRPAISVLQWIQYQLDNSATVEEVIASDKKLRIATVGTTPLHYLVADKQGKVATIEFLNGKMIIHQGSTLKYPVLANSTYQESLKHVQSGNGLSNGNSEASSLGRFAKACSMVQDYQQKKSKVPAVDYAFQILKEVSQGDFTKWSIVYNITESKIYFRTDSHKKIKLVDVTLFNFACNEMPRTFNINSPVEGDVSRRFEVFSKDINKRTLERSFMESNSQIDIPPSYTEKIIAYPAGIRCR
jgi:choloylglycine hydrolase